MLGVKLVATFLGLVPPAADGLFVVGHQGVLEGVEAFLQRTKCFEERATVVAKDGRPESGVGGGDAAAVAVGAGGQRQPFGGNRRRQGGRHRVGKWLV